MNKNNFKKTNHLENLNQIEEKIVDIKIEKSRLNREKSIMVFNKAVFFYFSFLFIAIIGFVNNHINRNFFNTLIGMGLCALITGSLPYVFVMSREEKNLDKMINILKKIEGGN